MQEKYKYPYNPYKLASLFCIERLKRFLAQNEQKQKPRTTIAFESRGKLEDSDLQKTINNMKGARNFDIKIIDKKSNCLGLQLADLIARPIGRHILDPKQSNRAYDIIETKFFNKNGLFLDKGLKIFPE